MDTLKDSPMDHGHRLGRLAARAAGLALSIAALVTLAGCGQSNPVAELRDSGVIVNVQRGARRDIDVIRFPAGATDDMLAPLADLKGAVEVDLSGTDVTAEGLAHLKGLAGLSKLNLTNTPVGDDAMEIVAGLKDLTDLRIGGTRVTAEGVEHLKELPRLELLSVAAPPKPTKPPERSWKTAVNMGIDLAGGTNLVFQVNRNETDKEINSDTMSQMVSAVSRRINPSGTEEVTVRQVGADRIEVIIPGADPETVREMKSKITRLGSLEFALLANRRDHADVIAEVRKLPDTQRDYRPDGVLRAGWREVAEGEVLDQQGDVVSRPSTGGGQEFLVLFGEPNQRITGDYLVKASASTDDAGRPAVNFVLNTRGGFLFQELTSLNRPSEDGQFERRLAILLDEKIQSAPSIKTTIQDQGQITGLDSRQEVEELVGVLNAGALAVPLEREPVNEFTISPLLGEDVQQKGIWATVIAGVIVFACLLAYYAWAGVIAVSCMLLNLVLLMGAMAFIDATFSLPGIAGIVLTIGMAVDANVLVYERIREEQARGSSLRMAIHNGFDKALSAIVDGNITQLITAAVLYMIGTDQIRGFAVTLFLGIAISMFTALYFGRLCFDLIERRRVLRRFWMADPFGIPRWDFVGKGRIAIPFSILLLAVGFVALFARGEDNLDIDFTGGAMVTFELEDEAKIDDVRAALSDSEVLGGAMTLETLALGVGDLSTETGKRFRVRTKEQNVPAVREAVAAEMESAGLDLQYVFLDPGQVEEIPEDTDRAELKPFAGGYSVPLAFSDVRGGDPQSDFSGLRPNSAKAALATQLGAIENEEERAKYEAPEEFFAVVGTRKAEADPASGDTSRFTEMVVRTFPGLPREDLQTALAGMEAEMAREPQFEEVNSFASSIADEMKASAVVALIVSTLAIIAYLWFRFQRVSYGLAAVIAVVHDVLVVLVAIPLASYLAGVIGYGTLGLEDFKINLSVVAAMLTILGYSLNDTIVIFDRIREIRGKNPNLTRDMVNQAVNATLSRTLLTSITTLIVSVILYAFGGEGLHTFAFCLVVGVVVGTYSTMWIACPALLWLNKYFGHAAHPVRSGAWQAPQAAGAR